MSEKPERYPDMYPHEIAMLQEEKARHDDLVFAHKRAMVLANMVGACGHESPEVTGTILGNVRRKVEEIQAENKRLTAALRDATALNEKYREAIDKARDYIANGNHIVQAMSVLGAALSDSGQKEDV